MSVKKECAYFICGQVFPLEEDIHVLEKNLQNHSTMAGITLILGVWERTSSML